MQRQISRLMYDYVPLCSYDGHCASSLHTSYCRKFLGERHPTAVTTMQQNKTYLMRFIGAPRRHSNLMVRYMLLRRDEMYKNLSKKQGQIVVDAFNPMRVQ